MFYHPGDFCVGHRLPNRCQRRQRVHDVADASEFYDQYTHYLVGSEQWAVSSGPWAESWSWQGDSVRARGIDKSWIRKFIFTLRSCCPLPTAHPLSSTAPRLNDLSGLRQFVLSLQKIVPHRVPGQFPRCSRCPSHECPP